MAINLVVATHGKFGAELIKSAGMLAGDTSAIKSLSLMPGMSLEDFMHQADNTLSQLSGDILCYVDLFGGTPSNTMTALTKKYPMTVLTGLNLPMFIDSFLKIQAGEDDVETVVKSALDAASQSVVITNEKLKEGK